MKRILTSIFFIFSLNLCAQNGLHFDGINDYVQTPNPGPTGSADRTIELWLKTNNSISTQQVIVDWGNMNTGQRFTLNMINFGRIRIEVGGNGFNSNSTVADGNWHHVAVTYDNSATTKFNIYIDGVLDISGNTTIAVNTASAGIILGRRNDLTNYFQGTIDEVRIWNTVRTATEISSNMNAEFCTVPANLISYYTFNQGNAGSGNSGQNKLLDALGTNNGTLNGFSLAGINSNWVTGSALSGGLTISSFKMSACDNYLSPSGNQNWTSSGKYQDTLQNANSCDSLLFINLTIGNTVFDTLVEDVCDTFPSPSGKYNWASSGVFYDTTLNSSGCNTYYTVDLTATIIDTSVTENGNVFTANESGSLYQWVDCNNNFVKIANANTQQFTPTKDGSYAVTITNVNCMDTSGCHRALAVGLSETVIWNAQVYPNPVEDYLTIDLGLQQDIVHLEIRSLSSTLIKRVQAKGNTKIDLNELAPGMYQVVLRKDEAVFLHEKLLKLQ